jgi:hypothetical protein
VVLSAAESDEIFFTGSFRGLHNTISKDVLRSTKEVARDLAEAVRVFLEKVL